MREFRQPLPIELDTSAWTNGFGSTLIQVVKKPAELMNLLVYDGNYIRSCGSFSGYEIRVTGRDGYEKTVHGDTPWATVHKALADYEQYVKDREDTAKMLEEYRRGTLNIPAAAKAC